MMMNDQLIEANIILLGLADELANDLSEALGRFCEGIQTRRPLADSVQALHELQRLDVNLVFCRPVPSLIRRLRGMNPSVSIIAVSRIPETSEWIDSIEAGADDYCAAPFETAQLRWMFESCLSYARAAA
jgi:DNA-binding response OmpR family regulator